MGTTQSTTLNTDTNTVATTGEHGDRGDGTSKWLHWQRIADGGDAALGAKADTAVTDPTDSGSVIALLKGIVAFLRTSAAGVGKAEDAPHASGDVGIMPLAVRRDTMAASSGASGDYEPLQTDATGRLRVTDTGPAPSNATTTALAASLVVKASAGVLYGIQGVNDSADAQYIHVYDAASLPADSAVPAIVILVDAGANYSLDLGRRGRQFSTGIVVGNSTTLATKTIGAADCWIDAQYE